MLPNWFCAQTTQRVLKPEFVVGSTFVTCCTGLYEPHDSDKFLLVYRSLNVFKVDVRNQQAFPEVKGRK